MIPALSFLGPLTSTVGDASGNSVSALAGTAAGAPDDFGALLSQVSNEAMGTLKTAESTAISGITGSVPVQQVVNSVLDAQGALQTALAIRDKLVSAYQEVSRMAI